jgi:hypothetical protein
MPDKREDLKQRYAALLDDLKDAHKTDPLALAIMGAMAQTVATKGGAKNWRKFKQKMSQDQYSALMSELQAKGNKFWKDGKKREAYACQALGMSLAASTQRTDPVLRQGEELLDDFINRAAKAAKAAKGTPPTKVAQKP